MPYRVLEVTQPVLLRKSRGFLQVVKRSEVLAQIPLDDLACCIVATPAATISTGVISELVDRCIVVVTCDSKYIPCSVVLPTSGFGRQYKVMAAQAETSVPSRKRAWKATVQAKIRNQAQVLHDSGSAKGSRLHELVKEVRSGDPTNIEAQAARIYWRALFGESFRRDRQVAGSNAALNYGYAVVRGCIARGIAAAGLHPSISMHHKNPQNTCNLADDLIEPFRPLVDRAVSQLPSTLLEKETLSPEARRALAALTLAVCTLDGDAAPLSLACVRVARSYARYCTGESKEFLLPELRPMSEQKALVDEDQAVETLLPDLRIFRLPKREADRLAI